MSAPVSKASRAERRMFLGVCGVGVKALSFRRRILARESRWEEVG